ncbi:superfamily I DNA/RNA helicase [Gluconacetobacter johannae DSM 13595]|uniref:DNA 3'-5' helicase II n=1 Tax=Gluconacetobacter johannae TaxID=112140 RepID=A0A7W4J8J3_9PROT|nr:ATP-binding domain-containing protein [Gluconacetobacter johannae]MBB2176673.1 ATP-binding domain-containing protein [Gluconacetobacter johannae]GBQ91297.1 superfamily I DNA/RNA helicase [Gluconacetobacter johannae DSM 13595]
MSISYIPTVSGDPINAVAGEVIRKIRAGDVYAADDDIVLYAGWPKVKDYDGRPHSADLTILGKDHGLKLLKISLAANARDLRRDAQTIAQVAASTESLMGKSLALKKRRQLIFEVVPVLYAPNLGEPYDNEEIEIARTEAEFVRILKEESGPLSDAQRNEVRAIVEGAKALGQLSEAEDDDTLSDIARAYRELEAVIYNFDAAQRSVALTSIRGPQRIRGLAGTGKTVILAMKAALAHIENPNAKILITYYTRSLRDVMERMITRFHRHFAEVDPNWDNLHVRHGWGRSNLTGVYREACIREGLVPRSFSDVRSAADPFGTVCRELVDAKVLSPYYDIILVDEGQDFPDGFYQMCFFLAKGKRDQKQIIWAYDELQNVFDVNVREPEQLFGQDHDGEPRISLARSLPVGTDTNDFVLQRAYRNQREILVLAHSLGFGVYGKTVQMLENEKHWEDVGYDVIDGTFTAGSLCIVERPMANSPTTLDSPPGVNLVEIIGADNLAAEVEHAVIEIRKFVNDGLKADEILVVCLDDRASKSYFSKLSGLLAQSDIACNNILNNPYSEPAFRIDGKVTLSTVYRAKGNEAAVVIVLGADAAVLETRLGRNKLFVAFTRTKGWLRIFGCNNKNFARLRGEVVMALSKSPRIEFVMPDMTNLNTIQRGLEEKHARLLEAKRRVDRIRSEFNLSQDDMANLLEEE